MVPVPWEEKVASFVKTHRLSEDLALQLYDSGQAQLFEKLVSELKLDGSVIASVLAEAPARMAREGVPEDRITPEVFEAVLRSLDSGTFAKEAAYDALKLLSSGEARDVTEAVKKLGLKAMTDDELEALVSQVVARNRSLISERGDRAFSVLMGEVMKVARGRVDGGRVSSAIKRRMDASQRPS
jgi:Glu-tRNA(Gln) amidotransferase subunit E-like FAD-binding protein